VRRVFASTSSAPAYSYDPYGNALQGTAPLTDFNYAGMFYNADSGLYLTQYRVYDPVSGRWLSRDPLGEVSDIADSTTSTVLFGAFRPARPLDDNSLGGLSSLGYNPYRDPPTVTAPFTNSVYFNSSYNIDSWFYLTQQSAYATSVARWISSNPGGEIRIQIPNLYWYVYDNPIGLTDPTGEGWLGNLIRTCGIVIGLAVNNPTTGGAAGNQSGPYQPPPTIQVAPSQGPKPKQ
jgi:RHS repeat-associated protein